MKKMLTTEQTKKAENNCGTFFSTRFVPENEMPKLFVPFTKKSEYYSTYKKLEVSVDIDFTDCLPGCRYVLDWWNPETNDSDKFLHHNYPQAETWAEAINLWRDINTVDLKINVYGLKSGIEFSMPASLFAIEKNTLYSRIYLESKDGDKKAAAPINITYNEQTDRSLVAPFGSNINGGFNVTMPISNGLHYTLRAVGPAVYTTWGY